MSSAALVAGNTVVFKPSSSDNMSMLSGLRIYEIFKEAGIPDGAFNYLTGPGSVVGSELVENPDVSGIAFTGSRYVGMSMVSRSIALGLDRHFVTEMSGKNPCIVSKGANLDVAANGIVSAAFGYSGQKCSSLSRLYVHESLKDELIAKIIARTRELKIGNPIEKSTYLGPIISQSAYKKYTDAISIASKSARILYGGNTVKTGLNGLYVEPTIIEAKHDSELVKKELFLPILTVESFSKLNDAITMANDTEFGLTAGFYGGKRAEIKQFTENIAAGVIYINREMSATTGAVVGMHSFVGWKGSSITNKGTGSKHYLQQFMKEQSISVSK
jgi:1-pyrroline-5-carboxylate dehydrogenase